MVYIKIADDKEIDVKSVKLKDEIAESIKEYVIKNFDSCVSITSRIEDGMHECEFQITL